MFSDKEAGNAENHRHTLMGA